MVLKKIKAGLIGLILFLLFGCSPKMDEIYFVKHPQALKAILVQCEAMGSDEARNNQRCISAVTIFHDLVVLSESMMKDPQGFGKQILSFQIVQSQLQEQIKQIIMKMHQVTAGRKQALREQLIKLEQQEEILEKKLQVMLILVAQSEGM